MCIADLYVVVKQPFSDFPSTGTMVDNSGLLVVVVALFLPKKRGSLGNQIRQLTGVGETFINPRAQRCGQTGPLGSLTGGPVLLDGTGC